MTLSLWDEEFEQWLHRTGNAKKHSITKKIPAEVFEVERGYLTPVAYEIKNSDDNILLRKVRKDNTVMYEGNRYTVPTGSFGVYDDVQLEIEGSELLIYAGFCDILLARHKICFEKGKLIQNSDHLRNKDIKVAGMKEALKGKFPSPEAAKRFLDGIHSKKKRYARDQFLLIEKTLGEYSPEAVEAALQYCLSHELYSAVDFKDAVIHFNKSIKKTLPPADPVHVQSTGSASIPGVEVAKRDLQDMIQRLKGGDDAWLN